ncbi:hypothetical protein HZC30_00640 [Candidatus Woesearchaeota archaeon]|nr:hypothetical protein [Candidatus Woesearchaeota archaeon]
MKHAKAKPVLKATRTVPMAREPEFTIQIGDPQALRKDLLESVRELILFMQGFDRFKKLQQEKLAEFSRLKADARALTLLVDAKMRRCLPKGTLKSKAVKEEKAKPVKGPVASLPESVAPSLPPEPAPKSEHSELEELEAQLQEIEAQLKKV